MNIVGITVSTNYYDILPIVIENNYKYFYKWIFITDSNDLKTQEIIKKYSNCETLFFNFKSSGAIFNKGGALQFAQLISYDRFDDVLYLILDSDILLPNNFREIIDNLEINDDTIYGCKDRKDYWSIEDFKNNNYHIYNGTHQLCGFFQLYKNYEKKPKLYPESKNASVCDLQFKNLFSNLKFIDNLGVKHLGKECENWNGRKNIDFFKV